MLEAGSSVDVVASGLGAAPGVGAGGAVLVPCGGFQAAPPGAYVVVSEACPSRPSSAATDRSMDTSSSTTAAEVVTDVAMLGPAHQRGRNGS